MALTETDYTATTTLPSSSLTFGGTSFNAPNGNVWFYVVNSSSNLDGFLVVNTIANTSNYIHYTGTELGVDNNFSAIFGPDGNVWFTSIGTSGGTGTTSHRYPKLVKISSSGSLLAIYDATYITPQNLPGGYTATLSPDSTSNSTGIYNLLNFNGQIWFQVEGSTTTEGTTTAITFVGNCSTSGTFNVYYLDANAQSTYTAYAACASSSYVYLYGGSDSSTALASFYKIAANGTFTKYGPFASDELFGSAPSITGLCIGPDSNIWFGGSNATTSNSYVGYITPTGSITEYPILGTYYGTVNPVLGLNDHIWYSFLNSSTFAGDFFEVTTTGNSAEYDSTGYTYGNLTWNSASSAFYDVTLNLSTYANEYSKYNITSTLVTPTGRVVNANCSDTFTTQDSFTYVSTLAPFVEYDTVGTGTFPSSSILSGVTLLCQDGKIFFPTESATADTGELTGFLVVDDVHNTKSFVTFTNPSTSIYLATACIFDSFENIWTVESSNGGSNGYDLIKINKSGNILGIYNALNVTVQNVPSGTTVMNTGGNQGINILTLGCDGNIWFTFSQLETSTSNSTVRYYTGAGNVTPTGTISLYYLDEVNGLIPVSSSLSGMPSGNQVINFFKNASSSYNYRVNLNGTFTKYGPFTNAALANPMLKVTSDGNLWFCGNTSSTNFSLGHITPTGTLTASAFVTGTTNDTSLNNMIQAPNGTFWFWLTNSNTIVNVTQSAVPTTYQGTAKPEGQLTFNTLTTAFYSPSSSSSDNSTQYSTQYSKFYLQSGNSSGTSASPHVVQTLTQSLTAVLNTSDYLNTNRVLHRNLENRLSTTDLIGTQLVPIGNPCTFSIQGFILPDNKVKFTEVICIIDNDTVAQGFKQTLNYSPLNQ